MPHQSAPPGCLRTHHRLLLYIGAPRAQITPWRACRLIWKLSLAPLIPIPPLLSDPQCCPEPSASLRPASGDPNDSEYGHHGREIRQPKASFAEHVNTRSIHPLPTSHHYFPSSIGYWTPHPIAWITHQSSLITHHSPVFSHHSSLITPRPIAWITHLSSVITDR